MDLVMSNDTLGPPRLVGGQAAPSFPTRSVTTKLRLRDGESHLLAGLLQDDERRSMTGFPGVMNIPVLRSIFGATDDIIAQTDIVMLLTPRIIRTHEYTARDLSPIYVGTNQNFGLTGPPPLIAPPPVEPEAAPAPGAAPLPAAAPRQQCLRRACRFPQRQPEERPARSRHPHHSRRARLRRSPNRNRSAISRRRRSPRWRRPRRSR